VALNLRWKKNSLFQSGFFYLSVDKSKYIHYEILKNVVPKTTLFIHGNLSSNRWWYPMLEQARLSPSTELNGDIILAEIRGCGKSSDVSEDEEITIPQLADEFLCLVADLELRDYNLMGHSTGGSISLVMLEKSPKLINKAILLNPVGPRGRTFEPPMIKAFQKMKTDADLVAEVMKTTISAPNVDPVFFQKVIVADAVRAAKVMGLKIAQAFARFNVVNGLRQISTPVLVLHGEQDQVLPAAESKQLAALLPAGRYVELAKTGHCPNLQDPLTLWGQVFEFLF
jgi:pimeloyl-ACP methyl ester carboxylesterase